MLRVLYSHSRLHSLFHVVVFYYFILQENWRLLVLLLLRKIKEKNKIKCINTSPTVLSVYKNMSFNNGFNIFYSITLLTVFIYNICCFASVKMNRDISLKLCFCHLHQLYLYKIH